MIKHDTMPCRAMPSQARPYHTIPFNTTTGRAIWAHPFLTISSSSTLYCTWRTNIGLGVGWAGVWCVKGVCCPNAREHMQTGYLVFESRACRTLLSLLNLNLNLKKIYSTKIHFCTKYNNSQSRLPIRQETLIKVHLRCLHEGHQRSKLLYHAVSSYSFSVFNCIKIWRWMRSYGTNDFFKKILRTYWTGG